MACTKMPKLRGALTTRQAAEVARRLGVNVEAIGGLPWWQYALSVELEHGTRGGARTNVTNDDLCATGRIALAHILETPDYYQRLRRMEREASEQWRGRQPVTPVVSRLRQYLDSDDDDDAAVETLPSTVAFSGLVNRRGTALSDSFYGGIVAFCLVGVCILVAIGLVIGLAVGT